MENLSYISIKNLLLSIFVSISCYGQATKNSEDVRITSLDSLFDSLAEKQSFNGNVLIAAGDKVRYHKSFGLANETDKTPINLDTAFDLASVSKQFTATAIYVLAKQGVLNLDENIGVYLPELEEYSTVTINHLLHHTSGFTEYMNLVGEEWDPVNFVYNKDVVKYYQEHTPALDFETNTAFEYSNTGYLFLAVIIERVSKKSYAEFLEEFIFTPLKMNRTTVNSRFAKPEKIENYSQGYIINDSLQLKQTPIEIGKDFFMVYFDGTYGDGGITSTTEDLFTWAKMLRGNLFFTEKDKEMLFAPFHLSDGTVVPYGFGWRLDDNVTYGNILWHSGGWGGYSNYFEVQLDRDVTIIMLQNHAGANIKIPRKTIRELLIK